jgi:hypothetical protein
MKKLNRLKRYLNHGDMQMARFDKLTGESKLNIASKSHGYYTVEPENRTTAGIHIRHNNVGFLNDYDGGPSYFPDQIISEKIWIRHYDAIDLIDFYNDNKDINMETPASDKRKARELKSLIENLDENDNPVLMIMHLTQLGQNYPQNSGKR